MLENNKTMSCDFPRINQEDPYVWCDFLLEFRGEFESLDELCEKFLEKYPKVLAKIEHGMGFFFKKDTQTDLFTRVSGLAVSSIPFRYKSMNIVKGKITSTVNTVTLSELLTHLQDKLPLYSKETFKPCNHKLLRFEYNTWTGFKSDISSFEGKMDMTRVNPILEYIKTVISNNDENVLNYIISWLRHIVVKPYKKTEVAVFLHSDDKGTGKGTLGYWLKNYVFGNHVSHVVCGLSKLTQKHNTCIQKKIFTMVEEIPATAGEFHAQFDSMKHLITDPEITIEPKGVDPYEIPNMTNFLMMSNNIMALKIEKGDRRYACFEVSPKKKGDEEYWDYIHNEVLTEETAKHFFQYLKQLPESKCVSLRKIPKTELRETMINNSIPAYERFFIEIKNNTFQIPQGAYMDEFVYKGDRKIKTALTADNLYRLYDNYCTSRKENCLRYRLFFTAVKKLVEKRISKINGKTCQFYLIKVDTV